MLFFIPVSVPNFGNRQSNSRSRSQSPKVIPAHPWSSVVCIKPNLDLGPKIWADQNESWSGFALKYEKYFTCSGVCAATLSRMRGQKYLILSLIVPLLRLCKEKLSHVLSHLLWLLHNKKCCCTSYKVQSLHPDTKSGITVEG